MKTKKRLLSILLSIVLVLGLMPGMGLTAYAKQLDGFSNINGGMVIDLTSAPRNLDLYNDTGEVLWAAISDTVPDDFNAYTEVNSEGTFSLPCGSEYEVSVNKGLYFTFMPIIPVIPVKGVTLNPPTTNLTAQGDPVTLTATVSPDNATDRKVKWSTSSHNIKLYTDTSCETEVGTDDTDTLTVYAKGISAGDATVTVTATNGTSDTADDKTASCNVTVAAASPYANLKNTTTVITFDDKSWYLIDYDANTVTLLAKECVGVSKYNESGSFVEYSNNPTVKTAVDDYYTKNISADAQKAVSGNAMFLLTTAQASTIYNVNENVNICSRASGAESNGWWLCSQGADARYAASVSGGTGRVYAGDQAPVTLTLGVRPALTLDLSKAEFDSTSKTFSTHTHSFTYSADGATITATCTADGCTLPPSTEGGSDHVATLTIGAPTLTYVGQTGTGISPEATITDANGIKGSATVKYYNAKADGTDKDGQELGSAPTDAGKYWAEITLTNADNSSTATAHVVYSIGYAVTFNTNGGSEVPVQVVEKGESATRPTTNPTNGNLIFGDWYADDSFNTRYGFGSVTENTTVYAKWGEHRVTWTVGEYSIQDVFTGNAPAADSNTTVNLAAETLKPDGATLSWKTETDVSGDVTYTTVYMKAPTAKTLYYSGQEQNLVTAGVAYGGEMQYALGDETTATQAYSTAIPTATDVGTYYVWYKVASETGVIDTPPAFIAVSIVDKLSLTITAAGASKTFDGTALTKNSYFTTGLAEGDKITSIKVTGSITSAGSSPNTASDAVITDSEGRDVTDKYEITYRKGTLVVVKKPVLVKADDKTKVYDNDPATDPELTATVTGEVKGYPVNYTLSREAGEAVGSYKITVTAGKNPNYVLSVTDAELTITEAPVPVYGEPDFTLPGAIRTIEANAFEGGAMSIVYIPDPCTAIGAGAFKDCAKLTQIRLPKNCEIGNGAFTGCGKVYVFAPAGGTTESWCRGKDNIVFVSMDN